MGGGLLQLVAYGAQDVYLTGNPQITYFKIVYRRHTNFSMEAIENTFSGQVDFGRKVTCTISRNGDLIHRMYVQVKLPDVTVPDTKTFNWVKWVGHALIKSVTIEIGGQAIDKHYGEWLHIWNELTQPTGKQGGYADMVGNVTELMGNGANTTGADKVISGRTLYIPLQFWFCRNPGLALPLIALQYHEVRVNVEFNEKSMLYITDDATIDVDPLKEGSLFVDYIYLDTDERRRMAQVSHEYLIEQLQFPGPTGTSEAMVRPKLIFNHPCKEFIWTAQPTARRTAKDWFNFAENADGTVNPVEFAKLQLNGHERMAQREGRYFSLVQPYQHHENIPSSAGINLYSFALKPEEHQPSGTLNASRIDNATLQVNFANAAERELRVYAVNYNVLRVMSGMGGLSFAN